MRREEQFKFISLLHEQKLIGSKLDQLDLIQFWYGETLGLHDAFISDPFVCLINQA